MAQPGPPHRKINDPAVDNEQNWEWVQQNVPTNPDVAAVATDVTDVASDLATVTSDLGTVTSDLATLSTDALLNGDAAGGVLDGTYPSPGLASGVAGAGLTESSDVLAVGAGTGITVNANDVAVDTSYITSGVYTPTVTGYANLDAVTSSTTTQYMRVGSVVTVSGVVTVDPTSLATPTSFGMSLPIASNFGSVEDAGGVALVYGSVIEYATVFSDSAADAVTFYFISAGVDSHLQFFIFQYRII